MKKKKLLWQIPFLAFLIIGTVYIAHQQRTMPYQDYHGNIFGTVYHITCQYDKDLKGAIEKELQKVDDALSMFNEQSIISKINQGDSLVPPDETGKMFLNVFNHAMQISEETDGAFDITVAPLVNAWGFGFKNGTMPTKEQVDSIRKFVGYQQVSHWKKGGKNGIHKADQRMMLDCSAIAKGYGVDVVAKLLRRKDIKNFMVEIGGEVVTRGVNRQGKAWRVGVAKPNEDSLSTNQELQTVLEVKDRAMATSGNYRNFYYKDGKRYAHTINPKTGYPVKHTLLSATVIAKDCATADAYATAFMVMGVEKARQLLERHPELLAYLIYSDKDGNYRTWQSPALNDIIQP